MVTIINIVVNWCSFSFSCDTKFCNFYARVWDLSGI